MIIGLTGSMAAGKSTVSRLLEEKGFYIVDADKAAHDILLDDAVKRELCSAFGNEIIGSNGEICRRLLADKAFSDKDSTKRLNCITHPAIIKKLLDEAKNAEPEHGLVVLDVPLLIESGMHKNCDSVWLVCANIETRYSRIMERDGLSRSDASKRVAVQMPQWKKKRYADVIINNDGDMDALRANVDEVLGSIKAI